MKYFFPFVWVCLFVSPGFAMHKPAYIIFDGNGNEVNYSSMMERITEADVLLFGELHGNPIAHWLQYEVAIDLHNAREGALILGAEMFEADNQLLLDEYLEELITERSFEAEAKLWVSYNTDYRPLVLFARENSIPVIASNVPRRYANMVFHGGFEALDNLDRAALDYIAPLPVPYDPDLPGYREMREMESMPGGHGGENLPKAQAIKDATMAHFIIENHEPGKLLVHFHGTFHSDNYGGIYWYLEKWAPELNIVTISTTLQQDPRSLDEGALGRADFILVVPERMTRTH